MARLITENGQTFIRTDWYAEDVQSAAQDELWLEPLTDDQVLKVMELVVRAHDANMGINWEMIAAAIKQVLEDEAK
jgi:hypothetical protein